MAVRAEPVYPVPWYRGRFTSWITTVDHKRIGILYLITCLLFFGAGGILAILMRTQLAETNEKFLSAEHYNEVMTVHGLTMVFLVIVPILAGFGNYMVPLMIGAKDVAFPRLNALSYWLFLFAGVVLYASFFADGGAAQTGWTLYPPLSEQYAGNGVDLAILALHILTVSSLVGAINFIVTIHRLRAPGMTWMRVPLFVWTVDVYAWILVIVLPALSAGLTMLLLDRQAGTHFFQPNEGGNAVLFQHVFWFFGHPEVYVMILPVMGIISEIIPVFSRKPIFGNTAVAFSTVAIGFYSLLVWAHHMFTVGLATPLLGFFMISSMIIAVPTGIKILNWVATTWRGNLIFETPMLFALGFIALFRSEACRGSSWPRSRSTGRRRTRTSSSRTSTMCSSAARSSRSLRPSSTGGRRSSGRCSTSGLARSISGRCSSASIRRFWCSTGSALRACHAALPTIWRATVSRP